VLSSQVNTLPKAKSKTRSKQNKDMHKYSSVNSERGVPLPVCLPTYLDIPCLWNYSACLPAFLVGFLSKKEPLRGYPAYLP
jgi:hypothetical protein